MSVGGGGGGGVGPQVNKCEQVFSDYHQMSVADGYVPRSDVQEW